MELKRMSFDLAFDESIAETGNFLLFLQEACEVFSLQIVGLIPVGPAGAWPEVTFRGTKENLIRFSIAFYDDPEMGEEMVDEFMVDDEPEEFYVFTDERFTTKGERKYINEDGTFTEWE